MDISALNKDFTEFQKLHGSIPDQKRWLSAYFSGFAHSYIVDDTEAKETDTVTTQGDFPTITTKESKSDFIIEIWDSDSDVGEGETGNWRPFTFNGFDQDKIPGIVIVDNLYISGNASGDDDPETLISSPDSDVLSAFVGHIKPEGNDGKYPDYVGYENLDGGILNNKDNLVLYDKTSGESMHICRIEKTGDPDPIDPIAPRQIYKVFFVKRDSYVLKQYDPAGEEPEGFPEYQIRYPKRMISKDSDFSIDSIKNFNIDSINDITLSQEEKESLVITSEGEIGRFIDLKSGDKDRYEVGGKIYFRARIVKNREYPVSYKNEDESFLLFNGDRPYDSGEVPHPDGPVGLNNPWNNNAGEDYDAAFDWAKIRYKEAAKRIGLSHFRSSSK